MASNNPEGDSPLNIDAVPQPSHKRLTMLRDSPAAAAMTAMRRLWEILASSDPMFVKCFRLGGSEPPTAGVVPRQPPAPEWNDQLVREQLNSAGVFETIRVSSKTFKEPLGLAAMLTDFLAAVKANPEASLLAAEDFADDSSAASSKQVALVDSDPSAPSVAWRAFLPQ